MTRRTRLSILAAAVALNLLALSAVHSAMTETTLRQQLAQLQPERIIVTGPGQHQRTLGMQSCPAPNG